MKRYIEETFLEDEEPTKAAMFRSKFQAAQPVGVPQRTKVKFELWDLSGSEQYRNLTRIYLKNADAIVLVYSANS